MIDSEGILQFSQLPPELTCKFVRCAYGCHWQQLALPAAPPLTLSALIALALSEQLCQEISPTLHLKASYIYVVGSLQVVVLCSKEPLVGRLPQSFREAASRSAGTRLRRRGLHPLARPSLAGCSRHAHANPLQSVGADVSSRARHVEVRQATRRG